VVGVDDDLKIVGTEVVEDLEGEKRLRRFGAPLGRQLCQTQPPSAAAKFVSPAQIIIEKFRI
jgi:hypothetical protein